MKVPEEFRTQYPDIANPPTLSLAVAAFAKRFIKAQSSEMPSIIIQQAQAGMYFSKTSSNEDTRSEYTRSINDGINFLEFSYNKLRQQLLWFKKTQYGEPEGWGRMVDNHDVFRWRGRKGIHTMASGMYIVFLYVHMFMYICQPNRI
jgi:mannosyl-oligosaccharide glucosidase